MYLQLAVAVLCATFARSQIHVAVTGSDGGAGTAGSPFRTINHAAAIAASGSTIFVHAGLYGDEQGVVQLGSKHLILQGDGAESTILRPHSATTLALPVLLGPPGLAPHRVGVHCIGTARVELRDLTIDGQRQPPPSGHLVGIHAQGGVDLVLHRVRIHDFRPVAFGGGGRSTAVAVNGDVPVDPTTLVARACTLDAFGDAGVRALGRAEVDLRDCGLAGSRGELPAIDQVAVSVGTDTLAFVRSCRLTDLGGNDGAAVRLVGQAGGCAVDGNRIARATYGIDLLQTPTAIRAVSVHGNHIASVGTAVRVRGTSGVVVTGNGLHTVSRRDPLPAFDDTPGNLWLGNRYAVAPGTPAVAIPGGVAIDAAPAPGASELQQRERILCGGGPVAVVLADFDADGHVDFATLDHTLPAVGLTIGLWRPGGHLLRSVPFGGAGLRPIGLVTGTFDGVAGVDLVALTAPLPPATAGAAFWVFGNDGTGAMALLHSQALPGFVSPTAIASGEFNLNAFGDLVVCDQGNAPFLPGQAHTFLNDGTGTVWFPTAVPTTFTAAVLAATTGDVDGDGKTDVVLAEGDPTSGRVHWLRGNNIGGFTVGSGSPFAVGADPRGVAIGDHDADGDADVLATATAGPLPLQHGTVTVLEKRPGGLVPLPPLPVEHGPTAIAVVDLDADGLFGTTRREALVLAPAARGMALLGGHEPRTGFAGGGLVTAIDGPVGFATADLDADGFLDLVAAEPLHGGIAILRGVATARADGFGRGCPGTAGREPRLEPAGAPAVPTQPNPGLQVRVFDALPLSLAVFGVSLFPAPVLTPCGLLIATVDGTWVAVTDVAGQAAIFVPIPPAPDLRGLPLCFQAGVLDAAASTSIFPGFSLTAGLRVRVGD